MPSSLNVSLPDALRKFVDEQSGDSGLYATPSEYVRALIRSDMAAQRPIDHVLQGLDDLKQGRVSEKSILDIHDES